MATVLPEGLGQLSADYSGLAAELFECIHRRLSLSILSFLARIKRSCGQKITCV